MEEGKEVVKLVAVGRSVSTWWHGGSSPGRKTKETKQRERATQTEGVLAAQISNEKSVEDNGLVKSA